MANGPSRFDGAEVDKLIEDLGYLTPKQQLLLKAFIGFGIDRLDSDGSAAASAVAVSGNASAAQSDRSIEVKHSDEVVDWSELFNRAFVPGPTPDDRRTNGGKVGGSGVQFTIQ